MIPNTNILTLLSASVIDSGKTMKKILRNKFIKTILATIAISFLPLIILEIVSLIIPDPFENSPTAAERLCEDPYDIYIQDYLDNDGSATVVDENLHVINLGGPALFDKEYLSADDWFLFINPSDRDSCYSYDIAAYDGEYGYWLILRSPVAFKFELNINLKPSNSYQTVILLTLIVLFYFAVLLSFAGLYSEKVTKEIKIIEDEEEKKRMLLVSEISHDLKTPLASVQGYSEMLLEREVSDKDRQDYLKLIHDNSVRTNVILQSLFMYSKLESAGFKPNAERTDICEFTRLILAEYITKFDDAGFTYEFEIPDKEIFASLDKNLFRRIYDNLIENSLKYNESGTKIEIAVREKENIEITISDNGIGIPKESRDKIFEPFYRANESYHGSGLGLAIVRQLVELHGGTIELARGVGCCWIIKLPKI